MTSVGAQQPKGRPRAKPKRAADEATVELIATVAHEIRSPLTTIKGFTKTLLDRWDRLEDSLKIDMLKAINADADRVTRILTELLDISRLEAGRLSLHVRPMDMCQLAGEVAVQLADRTTSHRVEMVSGDPVIVLADPDKVHQVLTNFIENAQKYTERGAIKISCTTEGEYGVVAVADEGEGIPDELMDAVFEKFARRDVPGQPSGTGLGLYISRGLIEALGGEIGVTSGNGGSTFWFKLPLAGDAP